MEIAICDDEKQVCEWLKNKIQKRYPNAVIYCYQTGQELIEYDWTTYPDILFLDIQMPQINGIELAQSLRKKGWKTSIIFVTAYTDYVFDAFDVRAFHYLVKPVLEEKLDVVLDSAIKQVESFHIVDNNTMQQGEKVIVVKSGGVYISIKSAEIMYAEVFNRKVIVHTTSECIEYYGKLRELESSLGIDFYRPHRAYLVHFKYVTKYDNRVIYIGKEQVMMAKQNYAGFVKEYMAYMKRESSNYQSSANAK